MEKTSRQIALEHLTDSSTNMNLQVPSEVMDHLSDLAKKQIRHHFAAQSGVDASQIEVGITPSFEPAGENK